MTHIILSFADCSHELAALELIEQARFRPGFAGRHDDYGARHCIE